jgi:multimeric flavodoxin WrbA
MKVISINASPNKLGSTSVLLKTIEDELVVLGHNVIRFDLYDYTYKGCISCFACSKPETYFCSQKDDLIPILETIDQSDGILFGSPVYIGHITGEGKSFIDRLYTFITKSRAEQFKNKVFSFLITQGGELQYFESVQTYMKEWFYDYIGMVPGSYLRVGSLGTAEDLQNRPEEYEKAKTCARDMDQVLRKVS